MKTIACLIYPGVMSLDVTGPMQVFASANVELKRQGLPEEYQLVLLGETVGPVATSAGLRLHADQAWPTIAVSELDTVLMPGGSSDAEQCANAALLHWLRDTAPHVRRLGSVCSGALILASAGLLDGLVATTHWDDVAALQAFAGVQVQGDRLHTFDPADRDGNSHIFTSAGVTAGIDLALALIEADLGRPLALAVARRLVLFLKRPGGQAQFSPHLSACNGPTSRLTELLEWIAANVDADLSLEALADKANMAPRTLYRAFLGELATTPARHVERVRLEAARAMIQSGQMSLQSVSRLCGFGHPESFRRCFQKVLGVSPQAYAQRFGH